MALIDLSDWLDRFGAASSRGVTPSEVEAIRIVAHEMESSRPAQGGRPGAVARALEPLVAAIVPAPRAAAARRNVGQSTASRDTRGRRASAPVAMSRGSFPTVTSPMRVFGFGIDHRHRARAPTRDIELEPARRDRPPPGRCPPQIVAKKPCGLLPVAISPTTSSVEVSITVTVEDLSVGARTRAAQHLPRASKKQRPGR